MTLVKKTIPRTAAALAGALLFFLVAAAPARAVPVRMVTFEEKPRLSRYALSDMVTVHPGDEFSPGLVERNRRLLEATGLFRSVEVEAEVDEGGARIVFKVVPYQLVGNVSVEGNFLILKKDLVRVLRLKTGDEFTEAGMRQDAAALLRAYENEGYRGTLVQSEPEPGEENVSVTYRIEEGKPGVIRSIVFEGNSSLPGVELLPLMRLTLLTFFRQDDMVESVDRLEEYYREKGFLDIAVSVEVTEGEGAVLPAFSFVNPIKGLATLLPGQYKVMDIVVVVDEGPHYGIELQGVESFSEEDLLSRLTFTQTGFFDEHEANVSGRRILEFYQERGYYDATVDLILDREAGRVVYTVQEGEQYRVSAVRLEGVSFFKPGELLGRMKTWRQQDEGSRFLRRDYLEEEPRRVRDHYRYEGFLEAEVPPAEVRFGPTPADTEVVVTVREGVRTLVGEITFEDVTAVGEETLRSLIRSTEREPYRPGWVERDKERILSAVSAEGYPQCRVRERIFFSVGRGRADIHFIVAQGERRRLGKVVVVGNRKTKEHVIRREFPLAEGDPYGFGFVAEGKRNLYGLGYFEEVSIAAPRPAEGEEEQDLVINVRERHTGRVSVGAGYGSRERFRGFVEIGESNLFGKGRGVSLRLKASTIDRRTDLFYREPWPFGHRLDSEADLFEEFREEISYDVISRGINLGVKKEFRELWTLNLKYRFEFVKYDNVKFEFDDPEELAREVDDLDPINISSAIAILGLDLRDNPVNPHRGSNHLVGVEVATEFLGGDTRFNKYTFQTSWYFPTGEKSEAVVGFRGGFSQTFTGFESLPLSERFYLGGARGVRGWPEDEVGPKDDVGNPVGGDAYALGIAEYRFPLGKKRWNGVAFFDVGNVWADLGAIAPTDAKYALGVGVRYLTLVGPLRLDYGHKLNPDPGESAGRLHFNIGFPF
jgi:outer membrane protein insertion porin family